MQVAHSMHINKKHYRTIWSPSNQKDIVHIIDQRHLPHRFITEELKTLDDAITAIRDMHVRGAGLIGATAGFGMYLASLSAPEHSFSEEMTLAGKLLCQSRPTAKNLSWAVNRVLTSIAVGTSSTEKREIAYKTATEIADEDASYCQRIGQHGLSIIEKISREKKGKPVNILTHCNAGWLAFVDYGSATAPIYAAKDAGIDVHVWVDETRPWNQGAKLTAWELQQENVNNSLITDNAGGHLMQRGDVDLVIVGTDRTTHTGDVANKIGTYLKALAAHDNGVPFYVALPSSTFDWDLDRGEDIPIEERSGDEITHVTGCNANGEIETVQLAAAGTKATNYSFDVTPARLITGLITERGIIEAKPEAIHSCFPEHCKSTSG